MELLHGSGGTRLSWPRLPAAVRAAVESALGSTVVHAVTQPGGFSPGAAERVRLADGRRAFVKAVGTSRDPVAPRIHRSEIRVLAALPDGLPVPRMLASFDDGDWVALVLQDLDGRMPALPWRPAELHRVLRAVMELADLLTPSPVEAPSVQARLAASFAGWRTLAGGHPRVDELPPGVLRRLDELAALEELWADAAAGDTLLHGDLRADNMLLTADRVWFVDWPHACVGAPWVDVLCMLPSVAMQGGACPEQAWASSGGARHVDADAANSVLAAITGYFFRSSLEPAPPNLPRMREFQRAQGNAGLAWLRSRMGWHDAPIG